VAEIPENEAEKRRMARERRRNVKARSSILQNADETPLQNRRVDPFPLTVKGVDTRTYEGLLVPNADLDETSGRYPIRKVVEQLRDALAVHTVLAYHGIKVVVSGRPETLDTLRPATPVEPERLLTEGRELLSKLTGFRSEDELEAFSKLKFRHLDEQQASRPFNSRDARIKAELRAVQLITMAYRRAKVILQAFENIQRDRMKWVFRFLAALGLIQINRILHSELQAAFDQHESDMEPGDLWELAVYSDINPTILWPQHVRSCAEFFEIARFLGRVDRGVEARLMPRHFSLLLFALNVGLRPDKRGELVFIDFIQQGVRLHFVVSEFIKTLETAHLQGREFVVAHGNRAMSIEATQSHIPDENRRWFHEVIGVFHRLVRYVTGTKIDERQGR